VYEEDGLRFLVDKRLLDESGALKLDYASGPFRKGFQITCQAQHTGDS
jgi:hypothetical protein